jgi:hypothetical protein
VKEGILSTSENNLRILKKKLYIMGQSKTDQIPQSEEMISIQAI